MALSKAERIRRIKAGIARRKKQKEKEKKIPDFFERRKRKIDRIKKKTANA